jgi:hypothetical protein
MSDRPLTRLDHLFTEALNRAHARVHSGDLQTAADLMESAVDVRALQSDLAAEALVLAQLEVDLDGGAPA